MRTDMRELHFICIGVALASVETRLPQRAQYGGSIYIRGAALYMYIDLIFSFREDRPASD